MDTGDMDIREFTADDSEVVDAVVGMLNAADRVDAPFLHPRTPTSYAAMMRYGWDGEPPRCFAAWESGALAGVIEMSTSEWDNTHLGWVSFTVRPDLRRRGLGTEVLEFSREQVRAVNRRSMGINGWDSEATNGFAATRGLPRKGSAINRRQTLSAIDPAVLNKLHDEAASAASAYDLLRIAGHSPEDLLDAVAVMTASINDAPTDDLDIEDEVFPKARIVAYEDAQEASGNRLYRVVARHRESGELVGHSVVAVETERPAIGDQHDTSVLRAHRGHRLGLLLKTDMLRWLAEEEPQLKTIDTWNAESNDHMIEVNEELGYEALGREFQFQIEV